MYLTSVVLLSFGCSKKCHSLVCFVASSLILLHKFSLMLLQAGKDSLQDCFTSLVNVTELQAEMEIAKPSGDLDTVFRKYCR
jgi:hypothetical protein